MATHFSCALNGQCQPDPHGRYRTLAECQSECQPVEAKELQYLIYQYSPAEARRLAPEDRIEIIRRETGARVNANDSYNILIGLGDRDLILLAKYPVLYDWLLTQYDWENLVPSLLFSGTPEALELLLTHPESDIEHELDNFIVSSNYNPRVLEILHNERPEDLVDSLYYIVNYKHNVAALNVLLKWYQPLDINRIIDLENTPSYILDTLLVNGYNDQLADFSRFVVTHPPIALPVVEWFLRYYPQLATAANIVEAARDQNLNFIEAVGKAPSSDILGRDALEQLAAIPLLGAGDEEEEVDLDVPDLFDRRRYILDIIVEYFHIPLDFYGPIYRNLWHQYLQMILNSQIYNDWLAAITYLHQADFNWVSNDEECDFVHQHWDQFASMLENIFENWKRVTPGGRESIIAFLRTCNIEPSTENILYDAPDLLEQYPNYHPPSDEVLDVLKNRYVNSPILLWITQHYPDLVAQFNLEQTVRLRELQRPVVPLEIEPVHEGAYSPEEMIGQS